MSDRSSRHEVRNPLLMLPSVRKAMALPAEDRAVFAAILTELVTDARGRAQTSWKQNKGPMAAYWKAVGAYAEHLRRLMVRGAPAEAEVEQRRAA